MIPMKLITNALGSKINGVIHYGDAIEAEIADYEFSGVKKVIWIHPNNAVISTLYPATAVKNYRNQFVTLQLSNEDAQFTKRLESYVNENVMHIDLDAFNLLKVNPIQGASVDSKSIVEGLGGLTDKYPSIKGICVTNDSREIEKLLEERGFDKIYSIDKATLYVKK